MKIKSNKTFECYETAFESWNSGKNITLDGQLLIPIDRIKQARRELDELRFYGAKFTDGYKILIDREEVFSVLDRLITESEGK